MIEYYNGEKYDDGSYTIWIAWLDGDERVVWHGVENRDGWWLYYRGPEQFSALGPHSKFGRQTEMRLYTHHDGSRRMIGGAGELLFVSTDNGVPRIAGSLADQIVLEAMYKRVLSLKPVKELRGPRVVTP